MQDRKKIEKNVFSMAESNDLDGVRAAIQENPWLLQSTRGFDSTLLHEACWNDKPQMVQLLISLGADVNGGPSRSTPLSNAIYKQASIETIQVLIDAKADLSRGGSLTQANSNKQYDVVKALLKAGVRDGADRVFCTAVMNGDEALVDVLLQYGISVNSFDEDMKPLLMWAACNNSDEGHYRIAKKLLSLQADVNQRDNSGKTPLYWAVSSQYTIRALDDLAILYLDAGAKLDNKDHEGVTPLLYAAGNSLLPMIELLAARAPKNHIEHRDNYNNTALHFAAENRNEGICQFFIDKGLDCNAVSDKGNTPLHYACSSHNYKNIAALINACAKGSIKNREDKTPLDLLTKYPNHSDPNYKDMVKVLETLEVLEKYKFAQLDTYGRYPDPLEESVGGHMYECVALIQSGEKDVVKSLETSIKLLIANESSLYSPEITEASLEYIRHMEDREFEELEKNSKIHPIISNLVSNIKMMLKYSGLKIEDILPHVDDHYLHGNINDHIKNMEKLCKKMQELTNINWQFNGINHKSESCYDRYPNEPKHPNKYSNVVTSVLIARGILSGKNSGVESSYGKDWHQWNCKVVNADELLKLNPIQLKDDIEKASDLLAHITGAACHFLHIYPVKDASYYKVLEKIGCIKVEEFYAFNAPVIDFDLDKLQRLKDANISMKEIWARYKKADHNQPLFEQICKTKKSADVETSYSLNQLFKKAKITASETSSKVTVSSDSKPSRGLSGT